MKVDYLKAGVAGVAGFAGLLSMSACAPGAKDKTADRPAAVASAADGPAVAPGATSGASLPTVLFVGTSLTAGYGLDPGQAYPELVRQKADSAGIPINVVNAGVSGETSAGALHRIKWVLQTPAQVVVIETGANDALRGLPVSAARANIAAILDRVKAAKPHARILLVQMEAPPNLGVDYTTRFHDMYSELAEQKGATLVPFLLGGVAGEARLNQSDGLHPNAEGERIVAETVWSALEPVLRSGVSVRSVARK